VSASHPSHAEKPEKGSRWLFFRTSAEGRPVFRKELDKLPDQAVAALIVLMDQYVAGQLAAHNLKPIRDDIYELRWRQGNNHFRVPFFRWGPHPVALTAFQKKQKKTPKTRIITAFERQKIWIKAFGEAP
jgi:phage-related protein